jgi:hypothetical protein
MLCGIEPAMLIETIRPYIEIGQDAATIVAIIVGGIWTYMLFVRRRSMYPKLRLTHTVYTRDIDAERRFLRVTLTFENQSNVLVKIREITSRILQLEPWPDDIISPGLELGHDHASYEWPHIDYRDIEPQKVEIEPGELDEYCFDYVIDREIKAVIVYSWVKNLRKRRIGWQLSTPHNLDTSEDIGDETQ